MRELQQSLEALEHQLLSLSGGADISEFLAEAEAEDPDDLPACLEELEEQIQEMEKEGEDVLLAIQKEQGKLQQMDGSSQAAEKAEEYELLTAQLEQEIRELAMLQVASAVLREGIERYRQKNQGPVVERASQLFARLTLNSFLGLRSDFDEKGAPILMGVRAEGEETVGVEGMSDGTCDQLYLALRIRLPSFFTACYSPASGHREDIRGRAELLPVCSAVSGHPLQTRIAGQRRAD